MRIEKVRTTSAAVLGLLSMRDMSGYELTAFAARSVGHFWPMHRSLIYRELGTLEQVGYIAGTEVIQERLPNKRIFVLTALGGEVLDAWLATPGFQRDRHKNEFLVKFFFASRMGADRRSRLLADYRAELEREVAGLEAIVRLTKTVPDGLYGHLAALHGVRSREALLRWISDVEDVLADESTKNEGATNEEFGNLITLIPQKQVERKGND